MAGPNRNGPVVNVKYVPEFTDLGENKQTLSTIFILIVSQNNVLDILDLIKYILKIDFTSTNVAAGHF